MANKKVSTGCYVRGLLDGQNTDKNSELGKVLYGVADMLEAFDQRLKDLESERNRFDKRISLLTSEVEELQNTFLTVMKTLSDMVDDDFDDDDDFDEDDEDFDDVFDDEDDDDFDDDEDDEVAARRSAFHIIDGDGDDGDDGFEDEEISEPDVYVACVCPKCHRRMYVVEAQLSTGVRHICPYCGERIDAVPEYETDDEILVAKPAKDEK